MDNHVQAKLLRALQDARSGGDDRRQAHARAVDIRDADRKARDANSARATLPDGPAGSGTSTFPALRHEEHIRLAPDRLPGADRLLRKAAWASEDHHDLDYYAHWFPQGDRQH